MYVRPTPRRNMDGAGVRYLRLAHNVWDPAARRSKVQAIYSRYLRRATMTATASCAVT